MNKFFIFLLIMFLACPTSCSLFQIAKVQDIYHQEGFIPDNAAYRINLQQVNVQRDIDTDPIRNNTIFILNIFLNKAKQANRNVYEEQKDIFVYINLKEQPFIKNFEPYNTISLEISILSEKDNFDDSTILVLYFFSEETKRSLSSQTYLYSIINLAWRSIFK